MRFSGIAGDFFGIFLAGFTILFVCLFLLVDIGKMRSSLSSVLMPGDDERWLGVWDRVTESVSRWAIGVVVIAVIAGTTQGLTAWLLGSSYALGLGVIAGLLDMIPNLGATIAGFILVPALWAEEGLTAALIMLVVVLVYQQVENSIITPKVQGKAVELSPFFIIVAVSLFGALLGVLGASDRSAARRHDPDLCARSDHGPAGRGCGGESARSELIGSRAPACAGARTDFRSRGSASSSPRTPPP